MYLLCSCCVRRPVYLPPASNNMPFWAASYNGNPSSPGALENLRANPAGIQEQRKEHKNATQLLETLSHTVLCPCPARVPCRSSAPRSLALHCPQCQLECLGCWIVKSEIIPLASTYRTTTQQLHNNYTTTYITTTQQLIFCLTWERDAQIRKIS